MSKPLLTMNKEVVGSIALLHVSGEIDASNVAEFKKAVSKLGETGLRHIVVDMTNLTFLDASGIGAVLVAFHRMRRVGGTLCLAGCNEHVRHTLDMSCLSSLIPIHQTRQIALAVANSEPSRIQRPAARFRQGARTATIPRTASRCSSRAKRTGTGSSPALRDALAAD
jgi:anti-sigma B factor antagonist